MAICSGCGGGGGGSSPGTATPGPPAPPPIVEPAAPVISYSGNRDSITVTQSNAGQLAYRAFQLRAVTELLETFWVDPPPGAIKNEATNVGMFSGTVDLSTEIDSNGRGYVQAVFHDFSDDPDVVVDGRYLQRFRPESGPASGLDYSFAGPGSLEFDNLTFTQGSFSTTFHGVLRITGVNSNAFTANIIVTDSPGGDSLFFENAEVRFSAELVNGNERPAVEISGSVFDFNEGGIGFSPLGPIADLGFQETAGYLVGGAGGGIQLLSDGPATHVLPISFAFVSLIMDLDGDGSPEAARRFTWPELSGETVVESSVFPGPIANAGNRRATKSETPARIHALFSHDDDGDWLTFEWRIIAKPAQSLVSVDSVASAPIFEFTPDIPGDYVFGLRATDGISASEVALMVRHAPSGVPDSDDDRTGGLEVALPIIANIPTLVDGRSAINWPYRQVAPNWFRTGFGLQSFSPTGNLSSIYSNSAVEGLDEIRMSSGSELAGAPNASAEITLAVGPPIFESAIELAGNANAYDVRKADFEGDGDQDLVLRIGTTGDERILVLLSTDEGMVPGPEIAAGAGELSLGDVDGDGLTDILNTAQDGVSGVSIFYQNPDNTLASPVILNYPDSGCVSVGGPTDIAFADIDGNGRLDIYAVHPCDDAIVVWLQNTSGTFDSPTMTTLNNHRIQRAAFGDINGDGRADAILSLSGISTFYDDAVVTMIVQPDGSLAQENVFVNSGLRRPGVTADDINGDTRNDLVIVDAYDVSIAYQNADGSLTKAIIYSDPTGASFLSDVSIVDLNDDQKNDLIFCDLANITHLLMQGQNDSFAHVRGPKCYQGLGQSELSATLDMNLDGVTDLVTISGRARGATDERALLTVFLQNVRFYPQPITP